MDELTCQEVLRLITLGEQETEPNIESHLHSCATCRLEAVGIDRLIETFEQNAEVEVPDRLDSTIRALLVGPVALQGALLRPRWAIALGIVAVVAGIVAMISWVDALGGGVAAVTKGIVAGWLYFVFASAVTLPLLIFHIVRRGARLEEAME